MEVERRMVWLLLVTRNNKGGPHHVAETLRFFNVVGDA